MFTINEDLSIYATRGDIVFFSVTADDNGILYKFQPGDIVRMAIYGKKDAESCVMQKDFPVTEVTENVFIFLDEEDTKIGESISKHKDYWYEVVLNPDDMPQTIIGYDEDGAKVFRLFPESEEIDDNYDPKPEDFPVVDEELDMTSPRPVSNGAIARAVTTILDTCDRTNKAVAELHVTPEMYGAIGDGVVDDTEAIEAVAASGNELHLTGTYKVSSVTLPKRVTGKGKIVGEVTIEGEGCYIEGVTFKGDVNFNARNSRIVNCDFNESAIYLNKWANSFISCYFYKSPIFCEIELSATNNFVNCYFSSANQFWGTPSNLHITGGWIEDCTNIFNLGETSNVFGVIIENCDIESCTNILKLRGNVLVSHMVFSNCVVLGNAKTTYVLDTSESSEVTNDVSVTFDSCYFENVKDFASIKNTNCGIQGLHQSMYTKDVTYDTAANISWNVRQPLHTVTVPSFEVEEAGSGKYKIRLPKPVFVGTVTCNNATSIEADRCVNGAFVTTKRDGASGTFNSTCYSFVIAASAKPTVTITTSGDIY